jgi:hypothetical protein
MCGHQWASRHAWKKGTSGLYTALHGITSRRCGCLDPRGHGSARTCSLHCTLSAIRSGTRYAKWAGGSRSQTHRRAAMGGFTQDDCYVQGVAPMHDAPRNPSRTCATSGDFGQSSREHCPRVYAICRPELGWAQTPPLAPRSVP